jgi:hypothetical protein
MEHIGLVEYRVKVSRKPSPSRQLADKQKLRKIKTHSVNLWRFTTVIEHGLTVLVTRTNKFQKRLGYQTLTTETFSSLEWTLQAL